MINRAVVAAWDRAPASAIHPTRARVSEDAYWAPMTTPTLSEGALLAGYAAQQQATRSAIADYLARLWAALTSWRTPDAERFATQVEPVITGGQQQTAALTASMLIQLIRDSGGTPPSIDLSGMTDAVLRGVPATEVYRRPFVQLWTDLSKGKPLDDAVRSAGIRLQSLAATDIQLAKTNTAQRILSQAKTVTGYRRVLNGAHSCAFCVLVATRTYHKAELLPIHPGCDCGIAPLFDGDQAPDVAGDLHDLVRDTFGDKYVSASGRDYKDLVVTHQHGELGPVLGLRGQAFIGPADLPG